MGSIVARILAILLTQWLCPVTLALGARPRSSVTLYRCSHGRCHARLACATNPHACMWIFHTGSLSAIVGASVGFCVLAAEV